VADLRIPSTGPTPATPRPTPRSEAARAAQKAFFDAARTNAAAPAAAPPPAVPVRPVSAVRATTEAPAPRRVQPTAVTDAPDPTRRLPRPGSLLDIKV
jgi:hypothetical protein